MTKAKRNKLDLEWIAANLADGWNRYVRLFGEPPHGTILQMLGLLELSHVDQWRTVKRKTSEGRT